MALSSRAAERPLYSAAACSATTSAPTATTPARYDILTFMRRTLLLILTLLFALPSAQAQNTSTPVYGYKVVATFPHSTSSYTEGFFYLDGHFYEGTGIKGHSQILITDPATGRITQHLDLAPQYFGEGIVDWASNLYEWTWQTNVGFVYNRATLHPLAQFTYTGEGWGMTHDAAHIITSDGHLHPPFPRPQRLPRSPQHHRHRPGLSITNLNELEYIHNEIYANVWHTNRIARISPTTATSSPGSTLTGLLPSIMHLDDEAVLNGIAYDAQHDRLFVTGKEWPTIFQIKLIPPAPRK